MFAHELLVALNNDPLDYWFVTYRKDAMHVAVIAGKDASAQAARAGEHARYRPDQTLLYQLVEQYYPRFAQHLAARERMLPAHVQREFEDYLKCGRLEHSFLRVRCVDCHAERLVAFSCKRRGVCPSCGARRMAEVAALLVDEVLSREPMRQWVLSVPFALRYLFATTPAMMGQVLGIVTRAIASHLLKAAGVNHSTGHTGAVTLIQRFGSALNLNVHFHMIIPARGRQRSAHWRCLDSRWIAWRA